jgi:hypothetical protein
MVGNTIYMIQNSIDATFCNEQLMTSRFSCEFAEQLAYTVIWVCRSHPVMRKLRMAAENQALGSTADNGRL